MSMTEHPFEGPRSVSPGDCVRLRPSSAHAGGGLCEVVNVTADGVVARLDGREHLIEFRHVEAVLKKPKAS
ncbi:hypothetical protein ABEG18_17850 [Alsobacter sp. KACC 23698]|uniref:DUF2158 domain-containing protein n=1 Tax=Alsobacter sp. KACC 23698 TaxID=3149229 RepID=A0AAU7JB45_9HYPH